MRTTFIRQFNKTLRVLNDEKAEADALRKIKLASERASFSKNSGDVEVKFGLDDMNFGKLSPYVKPSNSILGLRYSELSPLSVFKRGFSFKSIFKWLRWNLYTSLQEYHQLSSCLLL